MYYHLSKEEAEKELARWFARHENHDGECVREGPWSYVLVCRECYITRTISIHNDDYEAAVAGYKAGLKERIRV